GDDPGMAKLSGSTSLAVKTLQVTGGGQHTSVRNLQSHDPIQLGVACPPDRSKGTEPDPLHELKLSQESHALRGGRLPRVPEAEQASAAGAKNFVGAVVQQLNRIVTMRTADARDLGPDRGYDFLIGSRLR